MRPRSEFLARGGRLHAPEFLSLRPNSGEKIPDLRDPQSVLGPSCALERANFPRANFRPRVTSTNLQGFPGENIFHGDGLVLVKPVDNIRAA